METILQELTKAVTSQNNENIKTNLNKLLPDAKHIGLNILHPFDALLILPDKDVLILAFQCIAELAKNDNNRKVFTNEKFISTLLSLCNSLYEQDILHYVRAIGNIAYENDEARKIIGVNGLKILYHKVKAIIINWLAKNDPQLLTVIFGCILNVITSEDDMQRVLLRDDILKVAEQILDNISGDFKKYEDCISYIVHIINYVTDHMVDEYVSSKLCSLLVNILKVSENPDVSILSMEILRQQSQSDDLKTCLAVNGTCELIYDLVQKYISEVDDEESRAALKLACDLIVLILTGDEAMKLLYDKGKGKVFEQMISWMDCNDSDLITTALLAIGNFARSDENCICMVECGLFKRLIDLLGKHNTKEGDIKIQHALLSALRHLSIPPPNKTKLLQENIVEIMFPMIECDTWQVVFKLMGTFRMLVDGQEETALELISRKNFLERIGYWAFNSDHIGVKGEAPRLLVWLIKNCRSSEAFYKVLSVPECVGCLIQMLSSLHGVMQNEALLALVLLSTFGVQPTSNFKKAHTVTNDNRSKSSIDKDDYNQKVVESFVKYDIGKHLTFMINKYHEKLTFEISSNLVHLLGQLSTCSVLTEHLKSCKISESLNLLLKNNDIGELKDTIQMLCETFMKSIPNEH